MKRKHLIPRILAVLEIGCVLALGNNSEVKAREEMVRSQLVAGGISNPDVLQAMSEVPRHEFVPLALRSNAYADGPLPIGHGQTISQPFVVARMTEALELSKGDTVLEVGTGSGYQAAVLGKIAREVYTIEIVPELAESAKSTLGRLGAENVHVRLGDGYLGWPEPLLAQLKDGGRLVIPIGKAGGIQELILLRKKNGQIHREKMLDVRFVPMTGSAINGLTHD